MRKYKKVGLRMHWFDGSMEEFMTVNNIFLTMHKIA